MSSQERPVDLGSSRTCRQASSEGSCRKHRWSETHQAKYPILSFFRLKMSVRFFKSRGSLTFNLLFHLGKQSLRISKPRSFIFFSVTWSDSYDCRTQMGTYHFSNSDHLLLYLCALSLALLARLVGSSCVIFGPRLQIVALVE